MSAKIVFMGTPEFAVRSLEVLLQNNVEVCAVVTVPDKPAGRGQQLSESAVKKFALQHQLLILQPEKLKDDQFLSKLRTLNADLFVVVAFRMLPEVVWTMPRLGTINLHGSLLPQYRGAAPINWAVINGEKQTGATTFFIEKEIDTGKIIDSVTIPIHENDNAGIVHDRLMEAGAQLLTQTVKAIFSGETQAVDQGILIQSPLKAAPKIFKEDCKLNWNDTVDALHNKIRGLSPYPAAWTILSKDNSQKSLKVFHTVKIKDTDAVPGSIKVQDGKLSIGCNGGWLQINELQLEGKKRMHTPEFLNGFQPEGWQVLS